MTKTTLDRVIEIITEHLGLEDGFVQPGQTFKEDLGADSLDYEEMTMQFEDDFDIGISDEQMNKCKTVQEFVDLIDEIQKNNHG